MMHRSRRVGHSYSTTAKSRRRTRWGVEPSRRRRCRRVLLLLLLIHRLRPLLLLLLLRSEPTPLQRTPQPIAQLIRVGRHPLLRLLLLLRLHRVPLLLRQMLTVRLGIVCPPRGTALRRGGEAAIRS